MPVKLDSRLPTISAKLPMAVRLAAERGARKVAAGARARVPVESGALQRSIHVDHEPEGSLVVAWSDEAFYGHMVEFGTVNTPARPFLVPALEAQRAAILADVVHELRRLS